MSKRQDLALVEEGVPLTFSRYASEDLGSPTIHGNSYSSNYGYGMADLDITGNQMERVRGWLFRKFYENWMPFTVSVVSRFIVPRPSTEPWQAPFDLDGEERITRRGTFPSGERPFPYPWATGVVSGFMVMLDQFSLEWAWGKPPSGPGVLTPVPIPFDQQFPSLPKTTG